MPSTKPQDHLVYFPFGNDVCTRVTRIATQANKEPKKINLPLREYKVAHNGLSQGIDQVLLWLLLLEGIRYVNAIAEMRSLNCVGLLSRPGGQVVV